MRKWSWLWSRSNFNKAAAWIFTFKLLQRLFASQSSSKRTEKHPKTIKQKLDVIKELEEMGTLIVQQLLLFISSIMKRWGRSFLEIHPAVGYFPRPHPYSTDICCVENPASWRAQHLLPPPCLADRQCWESGMQPKDAGWDGMSRLRALHMGLCGRSSVLSAQTCPCMRFSLFL